LTELDSSPTSDPRALAARVLDQDAGREASAAAAAADGPEVDITELVPTEDVPLSQVLKQGGRATIGVLFGLALIDAVDNAVFTVLAPDIRDSLHISATAIAIVGALAGVMVSFAALPLGSLGDRSRRTTIAGVSTLVWSVAAVAMAFVSSLWQLVIVRIVAGIGKANEGPIQGSILSDAYPPAGRGRIYGIHRAALPIGILVGPLVAGTIGALATDDNGWRWAFVALAVPAVVLGIATLRLPEPKRGRYEQEALLGGELPEDPNALPISLSAAFARLKKVRTFYFIMCALGAFGLCVTTIPIYLSLVLSDELGQSVGARGVLGSIGALGAIAGAVIGGRYSDRLYRRRPELCLYLAGISLALLGIGFAVQAYSPTVLMFTIVGMITQGALFAALVPVTLIVAAITPFEFRSTGFALVGLYLALVGGLGGALIAGLAADAWGTQAAIAVVAPSASILAGLILAYSSKYVRGDIARAGADVVEERDERARVAGGAEVSLLQVRHLDFSYGPVQVLFDVSLDVKEGETLALLGTNGAGKSTLLRAVSGLDHADRGAVRLSGRTITYADPARRVKLGVVQVPGGKSVYPTLSVADNLLIGGYTLLGDSEDLQRRVDAALEHFPVLVERLDQPAGTLSGGEQQMLGLATAMILQPRILLIDELSLGLSPVMVQQVLAIVEHLKSQGLTMVIVEQSINIALSIADRAVFMEKGQVKFEGPAADLLERDDLVRAVFLGTEGG
jgi:ABC-type branched-subunit amino acid transport system ATPase component/MFS family permease